jgi:hypothetical protein
MLEVLRMPRVSERASPAEPVRRYDAHTNFHYPMRNKEKEQDEIERDTRGRESEE